MKSFLLICFLLAQVSLFASLGRYHGGPLVLKSQDENISIIHSHHFNDNPHSYVKVKRANVDKVLEVDTPMFTQIALSEDKKYFVGLSRFGSCTHQTVTIIVYQLSTMKKLYERHLDDSVFVIGAQELTNLREKFPESYRRVLLSKRIHKGQVYYDYFRQGADHYWSEEEQLERKGFGDHSRVFTKRHVYLEGFATGWFHEFPAVKLKQVKDGHNISLRNSDGNRYDFDLTDKDRVKEELVFDLLVKEKPVLLRAIEDLVDPSQYLLKIEPGCFEVKAELINKSELRYDFAFDEKSLSKEDLIQVRNILGLSKDLKAFKVRKYFGEKKDESFYLGRDDRIKSRIAPLPQ